MTRSGTTYTAVLVATIVLAAAAWSVSIFVLHEEEFDGVSGSDVTAIVWLAAFALPGAHVVAMCAAWPSWRRRSLYVTRLSTEALLGLGVVFLVLFVGSGVIIGGLDMLAGEQPVTLEMIEYRTVEGETAVGQPPADAATTEEPAALTAPSDEGVSEAAAVDQAASDETPADAAAADEPTSAEAPPDEAVPEEAAPEDAFELDEGGGFAPYAQLVGDCVTIGLLFAVILLLRSFGLDMWRHLGFRTGRFWRHVGIGLVAYVVFQWTLYPVLSVVFRLLLPLFGWPVEGHAAFEEYRQTHSILGRAGILFAISIRAPLIEEVVFRGVFFQTVKRFGGSAVAILASAVVFAAMHAPLFVVLNIFFLGLFFAYLFDRTGSIVPGIALHFFFNSQGSIALLLRS
jgi:membrane protease YdiL (CAAX protease family)